MGSRHLAGRAHPGDSQYGGRLSAVGVTVNGTVLNLEVAATPEARTCGLSRRDTLPPNGGLRFVLPELMPFTVWMKDTRLPDGLQIR